jgi:inosine/guanosine/xanthosine phosphorylase family protein
VSRERVPSAEVGLFQSAPIGILLGSGLDVVVEGLRTQSRLRFDQIEGVGAPTVLGHRGELRRCTVRRRACLFILGRRHFYEGGNEAMRALLTYLHRAGLRQLVVTSAAGSLIKSVFPGELLLAGDILDAQHRPPNRPGDPKVEGTGRPDRPTRLRLDAQLSRGLWAAASRGKVGLGGGTAALCAGPSYETPAEVRALQESGASIVTMSGGAEIEIANSLGIPVAMIAVVTNWATGISTVRLRHDDVLDAARTAASHLRRLLIEFVTASA